MVVVEEVVPDDAVGHPVHVDPGAAAGAVPVDHVLLDEGAGDETVAALAQVAVHVDAVGVVVVDDVPPDDRPVAGHPLDDIENQFHSCD